ncbi:MAG: SDR family oxidoreductase [Candidatus Zixiibacteriota bacterium]
MDGILSRQTSLIKNALGPGTGTNVLLTGGTGFVGDLLIRKYLEQTECKLWVLSRPMGGATAEERILDRVRSKDHHRIRVISGDLSRALNGENKDSAFPSGLIDTTTQQQYDSYREMIAVVDEVFHNASYLGLKKSADERQKCIEVNVRGTKKLLSLMSMFTRGVKAFFYTSTAFVHGRLSGTEEFGEDDALTNGWLNPYEESKWKVEKLVRNAGYPYRIFRPGMIAREQGVDILSSHTIYGVADILESGYKSCHPSESSAPTHLRVKGMLDAAHNIIIRSELVDMIFDIRASGHEMNHTYNTLNPVNTRLEDVVYAILHNLDPAITYEFVSDIDQRRTLNRIELLLERAVYPLYEEYLFKKSPEFSMNNVRDALGEEYVPEHVTRVDRSLLTKLMEDYFRTKWSRRLPKK